MKPETCIFDDCSRNCDGNGGGGTGLRNNWSLEVSFSNLPDSVTGTKVSEEKSISRSPAMSLAPMQALDVEIVRPETLRVTPDTSVGGASSVTKHKERESGERGDGGGGGGGGGERERESIMKNNHLSKKDNSSRACVILERFHTCVLGSPKA